MGVTLGSTELGVLEKTVGGISLRQTSRELPLSGRLPKRRKQREESPG